MNQVSGCYTEVEFDSLSFLVHGSVRDFLRYLAPPPVSCHFSWTKFILERLSLIVRVNVVLNRTVVVDSD